MSTLQELTDRLDIRDLVERYTLSVTLRDWQAMGMCFHPNARWQVASPFDLDFSTRDGIRDGISGLVSPGEFLVQMTHSVVIDELTPDRARVRVVLNEIGRHGEGTGFFLLGVYHDVVTKVEGKWGFESRFFISYYRDESALPGTVAVDYAGRH